LEALAMGVVSLLAAGLVSWFALYWLLNWPFNLLAFLLFPGAAVVALRGLLFLWGAVYALFIARRSWFEE
jgi:hypothetical protein